MKKVLFLFLLSGLVACNSGGGSATGGSAAAAGGGKTEYKVEKNDKDELVAEGDLRGGEKHGSWITYHSRRGLVESVINYNNGVPHGAFIKASDKGYVTEKGVYKNGEFHGDYRKFIRSKIKEEATFVDGKLDGPRKQYFDDGKIMSEENYKMGVKDGVFKYYNQEEEVKFEQEYKDGQKVK